MAAIITGLHKPTILILSNVWPEPQSSAAGSHMMQLIRLFDFNRFTIYYGSTASASAYTDSELTNLATVISINMNDDAFDAQLLHISPDVVVFDRFMVEEQFGWRVKAQLPETVRVLNTEDLHSLRRYREQQLKDNVYLLNNSPTELFHTDTAKRELASIYRSDLTLIISKVEHNLLIDVAGISAALLHYYPLTYEMDTSMQDELPAYAERKHFMSIGNFHHPPNKDAVLYLRDRVWPFIREELPEAELHVYGAYCTDKHRAWSQPNKGFLVKGRAESASALMKQVRVLLAPLRFGAGLKGKLLDAMHYGLPSVTTKIGLEGITEPASWPGYASIDARQFAKHSVKLYQNAELWRKTQSEGFKVLNNQFDRDQFDQPLFERLKLIQHTLHEHRMKNITGDILWHQSLMSTRYMSRWIELKEKIQRRESAPYDS